jgi:hypothetical protein
MEDEIKEEWIQIFFKDLKEIIKNLKNKYENNWAITGSVAIFYLLYKNNLIKKYKIIPSDIDILISSNELIYNKNVGDFNRVQSVPEKSVTYLRNKINIDHIINKIDISVTDNIEYITIDGINIIKPEKILKVYEENIDSPDRNIIKDKYKINILKKFIEKINLPYTSKNIRVKKRLFDYIEKNTEADNNNLINNVSKKLSFD